ncbi:PREDICTED: facilitated trehalose transporter Tret1-like [Papilio polytes]|uniref:facilitated trehalose transporter Tret1-like n=1 Tax=Papilio polytes TaxID=76194 RepID=UPI000675D90C|nr:PREDICTED: facilitated trehalose transporter Tret1-like [Papilio polytes]
MEDEPEVLYPDPGLWTKTSLIQLYYGILVNLTSVTNGIAFSFSSIMVPQLTTVDPKIITSIMEETLIVSVLPFTTMIGNVISGFLMDTYGRRMALIVCEVPMIIGWILTGFATTAVELIIGRFIVGLGCGMGMIPPRAYVTEISLPNMRGVNGSFPSVGTALGVILQAVFGAFMKWPSLAFLNGFYSIILVFLAFIFPETPYFLLMTNTPEKAEMTLRKFRSVHYDVEAEMDTLLEYKSDNRLRRLSLHEQMQMLFSKSACKPFSMIVTYIIISQLVGVNLLLMWTIEMLQESRSSINPDVGNIALGVTRLVVGIATSFLMLKMGRRILALISSLGVFGIFLLFGIFIIYNTQQSVLPIFFFLIYMAFSSIGYYPLPMLLIFELSPLQIRGIVGGIGIAILNGTTFAVNAVYLPFCSVIGFANVILGFSIFSLLGSLYVYFYLPETKDLTLQEIEEFYNERRPTLTSQRRIRSMMALSRQLGSAESRSVMRIKSKSFNR